jgi:hypothetical protein
MASLPTYTVDLPRLDRSDSSPDLCISTPEQSDPIVPYYSSSMPATTNGTTPVGSWRLSTSTPLFHPDCSGDESDAAPMVVTCTFDSDMGWRSSGEYTGVCHRPPHHRVRPQ